MLPEKFVERVLSDLGETEGRALCEALDSEPPVSVRLNPAKPVPAITGEPVPWSRNGLYLTVRPPFTFDPAFHAGSYYVQEASSQFVGYLLHEEETAGKRILDLCAAPGGKTTLYAVLAGPDGLVVANEIDRRRAQVLADNVRKWGMGNVVVTSNEPRHVAEFEGWFDIVAVDAPCSGEGMFRKDAAARSEWSEGNVRLCAARQTEILREAWRALKPGGTLLYSTCTFNRTENEQVLEELLAWAGGEAVETDEVPVEAAWGIVCGRVGVFRTFRFYPHRAKGEGFFVSVARKAFDAGGRPHTPKARRSPFTTVGREASDELKRWVREPQQLCFSVVAQTVYAFRSTQFEAVKTLSGVLATLYSGVAMGQLFKGGLKPDPALAFYCGLNRQVLPACELDREQTLLFLRRQALEAELFAEGVNLVCFEGQALGFVKRIGSRVNNLYPNSLRILKG